jgi:hypothetical protein
MSRISDWQEGRYILKSPFFADARVVRGHEYVLWSPLSPDECQDRMRASTLSRTGLMSMRLTGLVDDYTFKVRQASAVELGGSTAWADGVIEDNDGDGTVIRFRFGPLRSLRGIMRFIVWQFGFIAVILLAVLVGQFMTRPIDDVSRELMFAVAIVGIFAVYGIGFHSWAESVPKPDSLIRLLCTMLDAQVVDDTLAVESAA